MPRTGRIALTPMLNDGGKLIGDFTVARRREPFWSWGRRRRAYHMRWFEKHLPRRVGAHSALRTG